IAPTGTFRTGHPVYRPERAESAPYGVGTYYLSRFRDDFSRPGGAPTEKKPAADQLFHGFRQSPPWCPRIFVVDVRGPLGGHTLRLLRRVPHIRFFGRLGVRAIHP